MICIYFSVPLDGSTFNLTILVLSHFILAASVTSHEIPFSQGKARRFLVDIVFQAIPLGCVFPYIDFSLCVCGAVGVGGIKKSVGGKLELIRELLPANFIFYNLSKICG